MSRLTLRLPTAQSLTTDVDSFTEDIFPQWQHHRRSNFYAFSGMPLKPHNMTASGYDRAANADVPMPFDVQSVPVAPRAVFDTQAWPLCYQYVDVE